MTNIVKIGVLSVTIGFLAFVGMLFLLRHAKPVIVCSSLDDSIRPRDYCLMNPFRDTGPERLAEKILVQLRDGNTEVLSPYLLQTSEDNKAHILDIEQKMPIKSWRIGSRFEKGNSSELTYWASRHNYRNDILDIDYVEEVSFDFVQDGGEWKVIQYSAIY